MADKDIVDVLVDDHREIRALFGRFDTAPVAEREDLFREIVGELARHEAAEESIVHAATRDLPGGEQVAQAVLEEEDQAEHLLAEMEKMDPASDEFARSFAQLRADVLDHADHEERDEFPRLRAHLDAERRREMANGFETLKRMAPTRPHPRTPQEPGVRAVVGPIAGVFDRARDAARELFSR